MLKCTVWSMPLWTCGYRKSTRGLYDPSTIECNFAIPSRTMLQKIDIGYPKEVPPGIYKSYTPCCFWIVRQRRTFCLVLSMGKLSLLAVKVRLLVILICGVWNPSVMNIHHNLQCRNSLLCFFWIRQLPK